MTVDCHLLFPPPWSLLHSVHLSLPLLAGHLLRAGRTVAQTDLNVACANRLLTSGAARALADEVRRDLEQRARDGRPADASGEQALVVAPLVAGALDAAVHALRDAVARPRDSAWASQVVKLYGDLVSACGAPMVWRPLSGEYRSAELARSFTLDAAFASLARARPDPLERALDAALAEALAATPARLYGLSVACSEQLYPALRCAQRIRAHDPGARIVVGGAGLPFLRDTIEQAPRFFDLVDYVVQGDGEEPLRLLLEALDGGRALDDIPNLHRRVDGGVRASAKAWQAGFEAPAPPRFDGVDLRRYYVQPALPVLAGRRCYWNRCTFCSITYDKSTAFGPTQAATVVAAMRDVAERTGCKVFSFVDEAVSAPQLRRLADGLIEAGCDFTWDAMVRFERKLDRDVLERAHRAGMRAIYFGLESGSQRVIDLMEKGYEVEVAERCLRDASAAGIWTSAFVMVGFPGESELDFEDTVAFCKRNRGYLDALGAGAFEAHKISPVGVDPARFGLELGPLPPLALEHRFPQPGREALLEQRASRFADEVESGYRALTLYGLRAGNLLHYLRAFRRGELHGHIRRAEQDVLAERARTERAGPLASLRLADDVWWGAPHAGVVALLCRSTGGCVVVPAPVLGALRRGTRLVELSRLLAGLGEDPRCAYALIELGVLVPAAPRDGRSDGPTRPEREAEAEAEARATAP